jgi:hypothetical protein
MSSAFWCMGLVSYGFISFSACTLLQKSMEPSSGSFSQVEAEK